jgi:hypothetical protein
MDERRFKLDFVVAFCALVISTVAVLATVYQTRVIARQFSATVWPYLSFDVTRSPTLLELDLRNDGLGPAIVRSVTITWGGRRETSLEALFGSLASLPTSIKATAAVRHRHIGVTLTMSTPERGLVVPANTVHTILRMEGGALVQNFGSGLKRLDISLCYCSLTGDCWTQARSAAGGPRSVSGCS